MKKFIIVSVIILSLLSLTGCASLSREVKSLGSDFSGGLNRTVTVYDYNGKPIKSWSGKFDVSESESETYFDYNGKRIIIQGGIIVNEED